MILADAQTSGGLLIACNKSESQNLLNELRTISDNESNIILDYDKLRSKSGFLTPVQCTGDLLAKRLSDAGISITSS